MKIFKLPIRSCCGTVFIGTVILLMSACQPDQQQEQGLSQQERTELEAIYTNAVITPAVTEKWARSCALCHINGEGGTPRTGDAEAWQSRLTAGKAQLLIHTSEGFNRMPPLGYCMDCDMNDFAAMIKFMAGDN